MPQGFLGGWLLADQQRMQQEQMRRQGEAHQLQQLGGLLGVRQSLEDAPLRRQLLEAQVGQATNPPPKWQVAERFNRETGRKEKVLIDLHNPANVIPMGGQEAERLSFQNTGDAIRGVSPTSGEIRTPPITISQSPDSRARLAQAERFRGSLSANESANLGLRADEHFYNTGRTPLGVPVPAPFRSPPQRSEAMMGPQELQQFSQGMSQAAIPTGQSLPPDRIRQLELQPGGGGMLPSSTVLPPRLQAEVEASRQRERVRPLTESQGRANLFGSRAQEADAILTGLEKNISVGGLAAKQALQDMPVIGGPIGVAGNALLSNDQQRVEQAQRNFVNAVLRVESGAVISPSEFENAKRQYFPQPGDGAAVIEQKRQNRQTAIQGLNAMASSTPTQRQNYVAPGTTMEIFRRADEIIGRR